ncbi:MAG: hypothetical protein ACREP6_10340 [Candidatus Binataceae bacterium]
MSFRAVARSGRRVDFVHLPILDSAEDAYLSPLKHLQTGDARIYLGMIHNVRDHARFQHRLKAAQKYLPDFGLAAPCGFGRHRSEQVPGLIEDQLIALKILRELRGN